MASTEEIPELDPEQFPILSGVERPFFEYWWTHISIDGDPHRDRWIAYEELLSTAVKRRTEMLSQRIDLAGKKVLDIGCQNGAWAVDLALAGAEVYGIDVDEPALRGAKVRAECHGLQIEVSEQSAEDLQFDDETFDVVGTSDVVEHVPHPKQMISEMCRVLKPGGLIFMAGPQRFGVRFFLTDPHYHHFGLAPLPGAWASWLARNVYKEPVYEVETLPTLFGLRRELRRHGVDVEPRIANPDESKSPLPPSFDPLVDELRAGYSFLARKTA